MNYLMISPQFPDNFKNFTLALKRRGARVFGLGSDSMDQLDTSLRNALDEYVQVSNMENYASVYRALAYLSSRYGKMDRIESHNEYWLELDGKLREDFNVLGLKPNDLTRIKYKSEMKKIFAPLKIDHPKGLVFVDEHSALSHAKTLGYPVVVKPDKGVGAAYTYLIENDHQLKDFYDSKPDMPFIMEEYINAKMVTYDGLVDREGNVLFENSFVYDKGVMFNVKDDKEMYYYTQLKIDPKLKKLGQKIVKAFDLKERFFHIEFFKDGQEYQVLEINVRPPGGLSMDMFNYAFDFDFYDAYAALVLNQDMTYPKQAKYSVMYLGLKSTHKHLHDYNKIREGIQHDLVYEGPMAGIFAPAIGDYTFIYRSHETQKLVDHADAVLALEV